MPAAVRGAIEDIRRVAEREEAPPLPPPGEKPKKRRVPKAVGDAIDAFSPLFLQQEAEWGRVRARGEGHVWGMFKGRGGATSVFNKTACHHLLAHHDMAGAPHATQMQPTHRNMHACCRTVPLHVQTATNRILEALDFLVPFIAKASLSQRLRNKVRGARRAPADGRAVPGCAVQWPPGCWPQLRLLAGLGCQCSSMCLSCGPVACRRSRRRSLQQPQEQQAQQQGQQQRWQPLPRPSAWSSCGSSLQPRSSPSQVGRG